MKVNRSERAPDAAPRKEDFRKTLEAALRKQAARPATPQVKASAVRGVVSATRSALASPEALGNARRVMNREVERLDDVALRTQTDRREGEQERAKVLHFHDEQRREPKESPRREPPIEWRESERGPSAVGSVDAPAGQSKPAGQIYQPNPPVTLKSAMELVERIEAFVRSQRPGLALTLSGALKGRVEIERVGPNQVSVTLKADSGALPIAQMSRIRDELLARGLKVTQLRVA